MATIERTGKRWRVRQFVGGKLTTVASCGTKPEAQAVLRRIEEEEKARSSVVYASQIQMRELLERWALAKTSDGNDPLHTAKAKSRMLGVITGNNWHTTAAITPASVGAYRQARGSPRACALLAAVLRWASDTLDQYVNPKTLLALKPGKPGRRPSPVLMSAERVAELESIAGLESESAATLIHCLSTYGWRPITAARHRCHDLDAGVGSITCQVKGGDVVRHLLLPETVERLSALVAGRSPDDPLFIDPRTGNAWELDGARAISEWARTHLKAKVYDLKRYAITTMLNRGIPAHDVASFTGHRTVSQVLKYSRTNDERQSSALGKMAHSNESWMDTLNAELTAKILGKKMESQPDHAEQQRDRNLLFPSEN